jgi:hypothetical protein
MNTARKVSFVTGTIDFRYDFQSDIVFAKPRWTLDSKAEVTRWYDMHSRYFSARFKRPKDLVSVHDGLEVAPQVVALFESYSARLHESLVRFSAVVSAKPRLRLAGRAGGSNVTTIEALTVDEALVAIRAIRESESRSRASGEVRVPRATLAGLTSVDLESKK